MRRRRKEKANRFVRGGTPLGLPPLSFLLLDSDGEPNFSFSGRTFIPRRLRRRQRRRRQDPCIPRRRDSSEAAVVRDGFGTGCPRSETPPPPFFVATKESKGACSPFDDEVFPETRNPGDEWMDGWLLSVPFKRGGRSRHLPS